MIFFSYSFTPYEQQFILSIIHFNHLRLSIYSICVNKITQNELKKTRAVFNADFIGKIPLHVIFVESFFGKSFDNIFWLDAFICLGHLSIGFTAHKMTTSM